MPDPTPTGDTVERPTAEDAAAERALFCGCEGTPPTRDRMCLLCHRPNLAAMVTWRADVCTCDPPDNVLHGIELRECGACSKPVMAVVHRQDERTLHGS
jgi:hypothetical protein